MSVINLYGWELASGGMSVKRIMLVALAFAIAFSGFAPHSKAIMGKVVSFKLGSDEVTVGTDILKFYQKPFVNWSKQYSKLNVEERIMMSANDLGKLLLPTINVGKTTVLYYNEFKSITLNAGDVNSYINTEPFKLFPRAEVFDKFLMLPLKQVVEIFGCKMTFNQATGEITLTPTDTLMQGIRKSSVRSIVMQVTDIIPADKLVYGHDTYGRDNRISMGKLGLAGIEKGKYYKFIVNSYFINGYRYEATYFSPVPDVTKSTITLWDGLSAMRQDGTFKTYSPNAVTRNVSGVWMVGAELLPYYMTSRKVSVRFDLQTMKMWISIGDKETISFETGTTKAIWEKDGARKEVKLSGKAGFIDESFVVPLDFLCEVFGATFTSNGKSVAMKVPTPMTCGAMDAKTLLEVTSIDEKAGKLEGTVLFKDKATVKFANRKLLEGKKPADLAGIDVFENFDENGQRYFQAFGIEKSRGIDPGSYGLHKFTCVGKDDFGDIMEENGKRFYSKNSTINVNVGDCVQVTGYTTKGMIALLDHSAAIYDCKTGKVAETVELRMMEAGKTPVGRSSNGVDYKLELPQSSWDVSRYFIKDGKYSVTGFIDGDVIRVREYSRVSEQVLATREEHHVLLGYPESTNDAFMWHDKVYVRASAANALCPSLESLFPNFRFQDKAIRIGNTIYATASDTARLRNGSYTYDKQSGALKIIYTYVEKSPGKENFYFTAIPISVDRVNMSVKAITTIDEDVTLLIKNNSDLEQFKWGEVFLINGSLKMSDHTYIVNDFSKKSKETAEYFYTMMASFTFVGEVAKVGTDTFDVKDTDGKTMTFETLDFRVAAGEKVAVELINESVMKPVSVWQIDDSFGKYSQTVVLDPNKLEAVMVDGVWKISSHIIPQVRVALQSATLNESITSCYQFRLGNNKLLMFLRHDGAIVNGEPVKLSQSQILSDPFEYDQSKPPMDMDFAFKSLGIPYEIKDGKVEAKVDAWLNPGSLSTTDVTGVYEVRNGSVTIGKKEYILIFDSNQTKPSDGQILNISGSISSFGSDRFFVRSFDEWERK